MKRQLERNKIRRKGKLEKEERKKETWKEEQ
jgi:hypothetical protein